MGPLGRTQLRWVTVCAVIGLVIGGTLLAFWLSGYPPAMRFAAWRGKTNSALCLVFASLALLAFAREEPAAVRVGRSLAVACGTVGGLTLAEYVLGVNLGIDELIALDRWFIESQQYPNRMAPNTALAFGLLGAALVLAPSFRRKRVYWSQGFGLATLVLTSVALLGYLYEVSFLYRPTPFIRMSPYVATAVGALSVGVLALRTDVGIARTIASAGIGGYLTRRLLVLTVFVPIALSWALIVGRERGSYSDSAVSALSAVSIALVLAGVVLFLGRSLDAVDRKRDESERYLRDANELTAALAQAATVDDVVRVTIEVGLGALGARAGAVLQLSADGEELRTLRARGYGDAVTEAYAAFPVSAPIPAAEAIRTRRAVFIESSAEHARRYPQVPDEHLISNHGSWAALPLESRGRMLGAIALSFARPQSFANENGERLTRLAWQCAQALDRALLVDSEREARERVRAALEAAAIGTYSHDLETGLIEHDRGVKQIFEFSNDEGDDIEQYFTRIHPEDQGDFVAALERSRELGVDFEVRYRVRVPSGALRWVLDKGRMTPDAAGRSRYLSGAIVDFSSEQSARVQAEAANRAKDEFLAMLGHELRNPLSPIVTSLQLMKLRAPGQLERERAVIERQVQHMIRLVDDLLDVSRITRGKIELRKAVVELYEVVAQALEVTSPLLERRRHQIEIEVAERGLQVEGDPERLAQVVSNLLTNAAKYTEPGGRIVVRGSRSEAHVELSVEDTGMGIAPELLPKIFELFVQSERTIDRSQGGLGLGLSLVRSLVEHHGGSVRAESDGPGRGSRFTIVLPARAAGPELAPSKPPESFRSSTRARSLKILVVDDNRDAAETLAEVLSGAGHRVRVAFDGPSAIALAQEFGPDLAFLDIGLPVMDGYELARRLRALPNDLAALRLVAVTGYGQPSDRERAHAAGFDAHLVKPVSLEAALHQVSVCGAHGEGPLSEPERIPG
jgi:signal transduction histidine kinase/ActR/RegA family two-component response regulator